MTSAFWSATTICDAVKAQRISAVAVVEQHLARIAQLDTEINAFTHVLSERALLRAQKLDQQIAKGRNPGPLCGVPFAVKNLFDVKGISTLAGAKINADHKPADKDALLIARMESQGAILLGALGMGEYAYDFTGENCHFGNCANPWNTNHMTGGSSSGSGAAVAGGLVPITLGSDTNGSIRVPASFCGIFGLKPTYGRLPRTGTFPFCDSFDHLGPMTRTVSDLVAAFDVLQGYDKGDHACANRNPLTCSENIWNEGLGSLRIKRAKGFFDTSEFPAAQRAMDKVCNALSISETVDIPGAADGRAAAYLITNIEGSRLHLKNLQTQPESFDPDTRDRFIAGAMLPASWYVRAQQVRQKFRQQVNEVFRHTDIILVPATPCTAPKQGEKVLMIGGKAQMLRPNLGIFTQPISAIGVPSCVVPTFDEELNMPIGVQVIARPWQEDWCLRVAAVLEDMGFCSRVPERLNADEQN